MWNALDLIGDLFQFGVLHAIGWFFARLVDLVILTAETIFPSLKSNPPKRMILTELGYELFGLAVLAVIGLAIFVAYV
jgi:hypothetical protein